MENKVHSIPKINEKDWNQLNIYMVKFFYSSVVCLDKFLYYSKILLQKTHTFNRLRKKLDYYIKYYHKKWLISKDFTVDQEQIIKMRLTKYKLKNYFRWHGLYFYSLELSR